MKITLTLFLIFNLTTPLFAASKESVEKTPQKKEIKRKISSFEKSPYTEKVLSFNNSKNVSSFLSELKNKQDNNITTDFETRTLKALSLPLTHLRGIYWRLNKIISKVKVFDNSVDSFLHKYYSNFDIRPSHIPPLWQYITEPLPSKGQFKKASDIQKFTLKTLIPSIDQAILRLKKIEEENIQQQNEDLALFNLDLALIYGENRVQNLINKKTRYLNVYTSDLILVKAWLQDLKGSLLYLASYNFNGFHKMVNVFRGHIVLGDAVKLFSNLRLKKNRLTNYQALSESKIFMLKKLLTRKRYKKLFSMKKSNYKGSHTLVRSKEAFLDAVESKMKAIKISNKNILNNELNRSRRFGIESGNDFFKLSLKHLQLKRDLLKGPTVVHDRLFTEKVKVNVNALFDPNNRSIKDLKNLLPRPNQFQTKPDRFKKNHPIRTQTGLPYLNLGGLLPDVENFKDLKRKKFLLIQRAGVGFPLGTWLTVLI
tara:strand:- start:704 stop:2152 length:1449 start_codon:yes stop_codon:yes gene_type:complete